MYIKFDTMIMYLSQILKGTYSQIQIITLYYYFTLAFISVYIYICVCVCDIMSYSIYLHYL